VRSFVRSLVAAAVALAATAADAAPVRVAVVTLDGPAQLRFTGRSVSEAVARRAAREGVEVLGPAAVEERLGRGAHDDLVVCGVDPGCLAEKGAALGVDRILGGRLTQRGDTYRVTLVLADAASGERVGGLERQVPVGSRGLQRDVVAAIPALLAGAEDATGVLEVVTDVPGADVAVNDVHAGKTPLAMPVRPGKHKVTVSRDGFAEVEPAWVDVPARGTVAHRPRLYEIPARERPNASETEGHGTAVEIVK
jgi:hypothetical protein